MGLISRGFQGRRNLEFPPGRLPPGQYLVHDFPVLSAGPTPRIPLEEWRFAITGLVAEEKEWDWEQFRSLPAEEVVVDIHCVTKWSKLDTHWRGVSLDALLAQVGGPATHALAHSYGGYTTNLPLADLRGGKAWVAFEYEGQALEPRHGGPARLLVPHLYFWKSAKWLSKLELRDFDEPGFWESNGYHMYGDPWKEQRYTGD
jgi:DMSO/TMAO reductase YedYZ molybdopterin-dependent catalytic subunit